MQVHAMRTLTRFIPSLVFTLERQGKRKTAEMTIKFVEQGPPSTDVDFQGFWLTYTPGDGSEPTAAFTALLPPFRSKERLI